MSKIFSLFLSSLILLLTAVSTKAQVKNYKKLGDVFWMTKNLDVYTFQNGDSIKEAKTAEEWINAGENEQPAWCYYENNLENGAKFGKLYNWYAVNDKRGLAPKGWRIPGDGDWEALEVFLGDENGKKMKDTIGWNINCNGINTSGFSGLPAGYRAPNASFNEIGTWATWWSSSGIPNNTKVLYRSIWCGTTLWKLNAIKTSGLSVRCIHD